MTAPADVSLIIPNYNGRALLEKNLPAVRRAMDVFRGCTELIVVDDASSEPGLDELIAAFPDVHWLHHAQNQGFSAAIATGVAASAAEVVVLLNSDVAPAEDFLEPLVAPLEDPEVFAVSPLILDEQGGVQRVSWNRFEFTRGKLRERRWPQDPDRLPQHPVPTLFTSGGSMAARKSYFTALGGFAPIYRPFYVEDMDLGVRAWRRGWRVLFEPRSAVVHQEHGSIRTHVARSRIKRVQRRNRLLFEWTHFPAWRIFLYRGPYYLKQLVGRSLRGDWDYGAGFRAALAQLPEALRFRREVQAGSTVGFEEVLAGVEREIAAYESQNRPIASGPREPDSGPSSRSSPSR